MGLKPDRPDRSTRDSANLWLEPGRVKKTGEKKPSMTWLTR
jgi:hypothetical protein